MSPYLTAYMAEDFVKKLANLGVPPYMIDRSVIGWRAQFYPIFQLLDQRRIPLEGWTDTQISQLLTWLSLMDSDKDPQALRIGEREARIATPLLNSLSGGFNHGVGRSGNLAAPQPKAAGASVMYNLTNKIVLSLIQEMGLTNCKGALVVPSGTGMSIGMAIRGCAAANNIDLRQKWEVLMPRIDHQSPLKGIEFINCRPVIVPTRFGTPEGATEDGQEGVYCSIEDIEQAYNEHKESIAVIVSTTTFFAPRLCDDIKAIAKFAKKNGLIHIINNAYGVQLPEILKKIRQAIDAGRVDAIIQSTDKNFLTPVGGAVIISPSQEIIDKISQVYPGRASAAPIVQLLVSLLSMGQRKFQELVAEQQQNRRILEEAMTTLAQNIGEHIIRAGNSVSCAFTLAKFTPAQIDQLGGYLYNLRITGPRVVNIHKSSFGSCTDNMPYAYLVMNAAIGSQAEQIKESVRRLQQAIDQIRQKTN
jgi:O-phospho-L-seryl-tRNASec:L-selenocysteinyl-tRNA synthase